MEEYTLPLTYEEMACLLLYSLIQGNIANTLGDHLAVKAAIRKVVYELASCMNADEALPDD